MAGCRISSRPGSAPACSPRAPRRRCSDLTNTANPVKTNLTNFINAVSAFVTSRTISAAEGSLLKGWARTCSTTRERCCTTATVVSAPPPPVIARAALITRAQLGTGWQERPAVAKKVPPITCSGYAPGPAAAHLAAGRPDRPIPGDLVGPLHLPAGLRLRDGGAGERRRRRGHQSGLVRCVANGLTRASGNATTYVVSREHGLTLPRLGAKAGGYRVVADASQAGQSIGAVYLDAIVLAHGRTVTEISFATFTAPPRRSLELRLARVVARRIARD